MIIFAFILCLVGMVGSIIPGLPGHPLNFIALLILQAIWAPFSFITLVILGILSVLVMVLDYYVPIWTAKRAGASTYAIMGSIVGMLLGMIFTPIGMILGTFLGALVGELLTGQTIQHATKSSLATLLGTFVSMGFKVVFSLAMTILFVYECIIYFSR